MPVAREARLALLLAALGIGGVHAVIGTRYVWPLWLLLLVVAFLLRELPRTVPSRPLANVSPIDGRVIAIGKAIDPFLGRDALQIRIRQNLLGEFGVHAPIEGIVEDRWFPYSDGRGAQEVERPPYQFAVCIRTDENDNVVVAMELESPLRIVRCQVQVGERVGQGQRCGLLGFGRRVDVYLPATAHLEVRPGQRVKAGSQVIASFVHK